MLQQMHMRIIRMPVRSSLSEATEIAAAQIINQEKNGRDYFRKE